MDSAEDVIEDLEWEEWDGKSPFLHHCIAGSFAGVAEHTLLYPFDTVKTHIQSYCADCPYNTAQHGIKASCNVGNSTSSTGAAAARYGVLNSAAAARAAASSSSSSQMATVAAAKPASLQVMATSSSSTAAFPAGSSEGMWATMRNLVRHGHAHPAGPAQSRAVMSLALEAPAAAPPQPSVSISRSAAAGAASGSGGIVRLWRGVQTMVVGCIPAHALYFSSYEAVKHLFLIEVTDPTTGQRREHLGALGSSAAGATATICHDMIMTPLDTVKQRMQLGHYDGVADAVRRIVTTEGYVGLYRSFPITLLTNVPYGMVMVSTNEFLREVLNPERKFDLQSTMMAGCGAGMVASAVTTPLDRVKTRLQTQRLGTAMARMAAQEAAGEGGAATGAAACDGTPRGPGCPKAQAELTISRVSPRYTGLTDAFKSIVREEGYVGLFRGMTPRLMTQTPSVAISWTTYEYAKKWLFANGPASSPTF